MITYSHTFHIQAAHFNDEAYRLRQDALRAESEERFRDASISWRCVCRETHGHNFAIAITVKGVPISPRENWIIDDARLADMVMQWDNKNLSMLPEFEERDLRATTENMAQILAQRIKRMLRVDDTAGTDAPMVTVQVTETRDIYAIATA